MEHPVKIKIACALALILASNAAFAGTAATAVTAPADKPTEASLHHLLDVMQAHQTVDAMGQQMDAMFGGYMGKLLEGKHLNAKQAEIMEKSRARLTDTFKTMMSWEAMEPMYLKVYAETFTQKEIDGMTAFYETPVGHSMIEKMPLVVKNTMVIMQKQMEGLMPKIQQIAKETADEIKAEAAAEEKGKSG